MTRLRLVTIAFCALLSACSKDSPTSPTPQQQQPPQQPQVTLYTLTGTVSAAGGGGLSGAVVRIADGPNAGMSSIADGSGRYTLSGLTFAGFTVTASAAGYADSSRGGLLTSGSTTSTANFTLLPAAAFSRSGVGNTVFDMPTYITRVRISGRWNQRDTSNFIVRIGGRLEVNEILRSSITYEGIHLVTGGIVEITNSAQIAWTISEVR